jgi:hypothetical protein
MIRLLKDKTTYETILRYVLGLVMLAYGWIKLLNTQFIIPSYLWEVPLKEMDGVTLTWAFLGHSSWYSRLLGLLEVIPALLLLFRKTQLLGALLLFPVLLNIFLINLAFDFLPLMQMLTASLLLMNLLLLLFHYPLLKAVYKQLIGRLVNTKSGLELAINTVLVGLVTFLVVEPQISLIQQRNFLTGDWKHQEPHYWILQESLPNKISQATADANEKNLHRYYFQPDNEVYEFLPGQSQPIYKHYELDEEHHLLTITNPNDPGDELKGSYQRINECTLEWQLEDGVKKLRLTEQKIK